MNRSRTETVVLRRRKKKKKQSSSICRVSHNLRSTHSTVMSCRRCFGRRIHKTTLNARSREVSRNQRDYIKGYFSLGYRTSSWNLPRKNIFHQRQKRCINYNMTHDELIWIQQNAHMLIDDSQFVKDESLDIWYSQ